MRMRAQPVEAAALASREERLEPVADHASTFSAADLQRLLDWYQGLRLCRGDVPRDHELADKIALELVRLRTRPAEQPQA